MEIKLYKEMNDKIAELLDGTEEPMNLYAAQYIRELRQGLQEYQRAEKEGLLPWMPCKVGDTAYELFGSRILINAVIGFRRGRMMDEDEYDFEEDYGDSAEEWRIEIEHGGTSTSVPFSEIGNTIFFVREEAEKKLEELERDQNGNP